MIIIITIIAIIIIITIIIIIQYLVPMGKDVKDKNKRIYSV